MILPALKATLTSKPLQTLFIYSDLCHIVDGDGALGCLILLSLSLCRRGCCAADEPPLLIFRCYQDLVVGHVGGCGFHAFTSVPLAQNGQNSCIQVNFSLSKCCKWSSYAFLHTSRCVDHRGPCFTWFSESERSTLKGQQ